MGDFIKKLVIVVLVVVFLFGAYNFTKSDAYVWQSIPGKSYTPFGAYLSVFSSDGGIYSKEELQNMGMDTACFSGFRYTHDYYFVEVRTAPKCDYIFGGFFQCIHSLLYIDCFSSSFVPADEHTVWILIVPLKERITQYKGVTFLKKPFKVDFHSGLDSISLFERETHKGSLKDEVDSTEDEQSNGQQQTEGELSDEEQQIEDGQLDDGQSSDDEQYIGDQSDDGEQ